MRLAQAWRADVDEQAVRLAALSIFGWARLEAPAMALRHAYPDQADGDTCEFIRYWFDHTNRRQLAALARGINFVRDRAVRSMLWTAFSRMIISKQASVSRAMDISHSRPHRVDARQAVRPLDVFLRAVERVLAAAPFKRSSKAVASVKCADARKLPLEDASIDMVITSPPYLNAIDYLRGHKFTLVWMGHNVGDLRQIRMRNAPLSAAGARGAGGRP